MSRLIPVLCGFVWLVAAAPVWGQAPSERERELEELVRKLADRVEQLETRLNQLETNKPERTTEERVEKLEESVQQMQAAAPAADSEEWAKIRKWVNEGTTVRPYWKDGLRFDSNDGAFKLKIGGRIHYDAAFFAEDGSLERRFGDFEDGTEFRRARLSFEGTIYKNMEFKAQYDFAKGDADFRDVYIGFRKVPFVRNLRIGQFKEPFSLEELTSSNYITFMERSLANTFAPARQGGVMVYDSFLKDRMTGAIGVFRHSNDYGDSIAEISYSVTGRVTALPWYREDGKKLVHLGVAYSHREYEDPVRFRARPEAGLAPRIVDTGEFVADSANLLGLEAAWVHGPFSLQGELIKTFIDGESPWIGDPTLFGAYIQASYFLTGEHRPYKMSEGVFDRVRPLANVGEGGWGAWELAARVSYLDLNDDGVRGNRLMDYTLGLNWYLNPNIRVMWNYVYADPSDGGEVNIFQTRVQIAF